MDPRGVSEENDTHAALGPLAISTNFGGSLVVFEAIHCFDHLVAGIGRVVPAFHFHPLPLKVLIDGKEVGHFFQHVRVDFGQDTPFLLDELDLDQVGAEHIKRNVQKLVDVTNAIQENSGISSRLLWSDSGENLAQKLIARLQRVN